jgi:hypothetical protein
LSLRYKTVLSNGDAKTLYAPGGKKVGVGFGRTFLVNFYAVKLSNYKTILTGSLNGVLLFFKRPVP